jgi:hypothetical protein
MVYRGIEPKKENENVLNEEWRREENVKGKQAETDGRERSGSRVTMGRGLIIRGTHPSAG